MEFFPNGLLVRLRSRASGLYLYAEEDGLSVVGMSPHCASENAVWEVRRFQRAGADCIALRAPSTGRYLAAAEEESADQARSRRAAAVQRDDNDRGFFAWRAAWAGSWDGDYVLVRDRSDRHLICAAAEPEDRGVFVYVERNDRRANNPELHWLVLAVLSPAAATGDPPYACFFVPRLSPLTATSAHLPVLGTRNRLLGYIQASSVGGLQGLLHGHGTWGGDVLLRADAGAISGEATTSGERVVTVLAFLVGGERGMSSLPLHLEGQPTEGLLAAAASDDDDDDDAADDEAGVEAAEVVEADAALLRDEAHEEVEQAQEENLQPEEAAHEEDPEDELARQLAQRIDDARYLLADAYKTMESKHRTILHLVEEQRQVRDQAAARRDWTGVAKMQRSLQDSITHAMNFYNNEAEEAAKLRDTLVRLGDEQPPSPPPLLRRHPEHLL